MSEIAYTEKLRKIAENGPLFEDDEEEVKSEDNEEELSFINAGMASYIM